MGRGGAHPDAGAVVVAALPERDGEVEARRGLGIGERLEDRDLGDGTGVIACQHRRLDEGAADVSPRRSSLQRPVEHLFGIGGASGVDHRARFDERGSEAVAGAGRKGNAIVETCGGRSRRLGHAHLDGHFHLFGLLSGLRWPRGRLRLLFPLALLPLLPPRLLLPATQLRRHRLREMGERRDGTEIRLRNGGDEEGFEIGGETGGERGLPVERVLPFEIEETESGGARVGLHAGGELRQRQPCERLGQKERLVEKAEDRDAEVLDGIARASLFVGELPGLEPCHVKVFGGSRGRPYHCECEEQEETARLSSVHSGRRPLIPRSAQRESPRLNTTAFVLLLALLVVAPLPYGGILPFGQLLIEVFAFVIAALTLLARARPPRLGPAWPAVAAVGFIALIGIVQLVPLPAGLLETISPMSSQIYHDSAALLRMLGSEGTPLARISIAPFETRSAVLLTLANLALFVSAATLVDDQRRRLLFAGTIFAISAAQIFYAAIAQEGVARVHGFFVNPNHFAGYLHIALALAFGLLWTEVLRNRERAIGVREPAVRLEKRAVPLIIRIVLWGVIAAGIGMTRSRAGIAAALFTTLLLLAISPLHERFQLRRRRAFAATLLALLGGIVFVGIALGNAPLLRFLATDPRDIGPAGRAALWRASLQAWENFPVAGSGLGTFREAFRLVQPRAIAGLVEHAHSDFLEILVTGGLLGAFAAAFALVWTLAILFRAWLAQKHRDEAGLLLAAIGAVVALSLHGIGEFNLSLPAIPATLAAVVGAAWRARK